MKVTKEINKNRGITLISLVITIIVMLILVGVTISMAVNGGLFDYAGKAVGDTKNELNAEQQLGNGAIQVDGVWYDSIDDYLKNKPSSEQGKEKTINVKYTATEGENLWSSTVTLEIEEILTLEEKKSKAIKNYECSNYEEFKGVAEAFAGGSYTYDQLVQQLGEEEILDTALEIRPLSLNQMRELAAYMLDLSTFEEFKSVVVGFSGGGTYEQIINSNYENEEELLNLVIDTMKGMLSYKDIEKLESLGLKVISVKTPYDTTLYTTSLGGTVKCTFMENDEYTFTIKSGNDTVIENVEIDNVRDYDDQAPHDVKLDFSKKYSDVYNMRYSIDGSEEKQFVSGASFQCENSILFKLREGGLGGTYFLNNIYVIKDEQYYKYFNSDSECLIWNYLYKFDVLSGMLNYGVTSSRQYLIMKFLSERNRFEYI